MSRAFDSHSDVYLEAACYRERIESVSRFFGSLDKVVASLVALDGMRASVLDRFFKGGK